MTSLAQLRFNPSVRLRETFMVTAKKTWRGHRKGDRIEVTTNGGVASILDMESSGVYDPAELPPVYQAMLPSAQKKRREQLAALKAKHEKALAEATAQLEAL